MRVLTTEAIMWELLNAMCRPLSRTLAHDAYQQCHADPEITVVAFDLELIQPRARAISCED